MNVGLWNWLMILLGLAGAYLVILGLALYHHYKVNHMDEDEVI